MTKKTLNFRLRIDALHLLHNIYIHYGIWRDLATNPTHVHATAKALLVIVIFQVYLKSATSQFL